MNRATGYVTAALLGLSLAACAHAPPDVSARMSLADTYWRLTSIDADTAPAQRVPAVVVRFGKDGAFHGTHACNSAGGAARWLADGRFSGLDQPIIITTAGCMDLDAASAFADRFWGICHRPAAGAASAAC